MTTMLLHFSDLIRADRGGLETTHCRLAEHLSTSECAWPSGRSNHRSCLIVSIVRIADITLSYANTLCTSVERNLNDVAEERRRSESTFRKYQTVIYRYSGCSNLKKRN